MKSFIKAVAGALVVIAPLVSFAQSNQPLTRAQVREELIELEKAGYNPATADDDVNYPADIQAAEARVAAQHAAAQAGATSNGGVAGGTSQSGGPASAADMPSLYGQ
ncbi:conserved exported hypothetical protein [Paraburkholderia piptadeniae]|uniref:Purine nucleoside phosphorylase n=1 Tax=Paraburkholderia piptadeniae TaxID=1701573 RepID=A0A1N7SUL9_9BURK|nr:DUF4148 domain-containing protein [Paraburkholderia piptadeniae]SIT51167.1 conserved exported hypothetical protein [Paraburkholderia piptadeniae]